jgi:hypothetical protein
MKATAQALQAQAVGTAPATNTAAAAAAYNTAATVISWQCAQQAVEPLVSASSAWTDGMLVCFFLCALQNCKALLVGFPGGKVCTEQQLPGYAQAVSHPAAHSSSNYHGSSSAALHHAPIWQHQQQQQ